MSLGIALACQDGRLDGSSVSNRLIWVDRLIQLLTVEEINQELLHLGDARRATDENDLMNLSLAQLGILKHLLHGWDALSEQIDTEFLEFSTRDDSVIVVAL